MKIKVLLLTFCMLTLFNANGFAGDIEQGTVSIAVGSNLLFSQTDDDLGNNGKTVSFTAQTGYFLAENFEIGMGFQIDFEDNDSSDSQAQSFMCFLGYHFSLTEKSNIFARLGGSMGSGEAKFDDVAQFGVGTSNGDVVSYYGEVDQEVDFEFINVFSEIGYEFFITKNAALDFSVKAQRLWAENDIDAGSVSSKIGSTANNVTTQLKFKLYF